MQKKYVIDTNCAIDDPGILTILQNGEENQVYIPWTVLQELDHLKTKAKTRHKAYEVIKNIESANENVHFFPKYVPRPDENPDDLIIEEIKASKLQDLILVTNDIMLRIKAKQNSIEAEPYKTSVPFKTESQVYTGMFKDPKDALLNSFYWEEGKLYFKGKKEDKLIDYENKPWTITPKTVHQNAAMELMLNDDIDIISLQSSAGYGKSYIALACALRKVLEEKKYSKIYVIKPNIEIGESFGFLPGNLEMKMDPYFRSVHDLLLKLHEKRPANKLFRKDITEEDLHSIEAANKKYLEYLPVNFLRGMNFENCICILDEFQNYSRSQARTILSRFAENCKVIITGDVQQVDTIGLSEDNNAINWVVKLMKGQPNFAHIVLKGEKSRGPIADLVRKVGL